ncbi:glycosyltransferase [Microvirga sp. VF16]|uniref:glycosyltransferase n=1 Tax=Microvirga sp. VF16 TaxID=2807101 RepID=UPI00193E05D8|nr:glycosyltransferase [Microvirga sp. VF16]QRM35612.1 glycosyltransferase [Microvirga sp. VF16]
MTKPLSVLVISPTYSHPADQGNSARVQRFGRELMRRGLSVDLLYYGMDGISDEQRKEMSSFWRRFFFLSSRPLPHPKLPTGWGIDDWCSDALCEATREIVGTNKYDVVIVNYVWLSKVLEGLVDCVKVIDTHDIFGGRREVFLEQRLEPRWFFTTEAEEAKGFSRADVVIGIQSNESAQIRSRYDGPVTTVGYSFDPLFLTRHYDKDPPMRFGYLGSGNPLNVRSIQEMASALNSNPAGPWAIAGTISRRKLNLGPGVVNMGMVDALSDFYEKVECVLNPMLGGTGLKIKTIEGLAFGKPMIGTRDAFEGIRTSHPFHEISNMNDFVQAMHVYTASESERDKLRIASRATFARYMAEVQNQYDDLVEALHQLREGLQ